ncbi:hypothetical protein H6F90_29690 [Trichocoleus sp. FACHB-591]|uniref:hypothetical protein n=1 Tax=Trichocoleus sp. FACHB-591 TaxID=2692872 RepID=UPI0016858DE9|nr:hypothetical protein [Trichocoleus sp. FACHB-591]MBD2099239.1 hypothetical protein [Trichocoleus sp. FACHB-591]
MYQGKIIHLTSPYLIYPNPLILDTEASLPIVLTALLEEGKQLDLDNEGNCSILLRYRKYVVGEFWRNTVNSQFNAVPKPNRTLKKSVETEAKLWKKILLLLERLKTFGVIDAPALKLKQIIDERALTLFNFFNDGGESGITRILQSWQAQNRRLEALDNPFGYEGSRVTSYVLNEAIAKANKNDVFRTEQYMPVVRARMASVALLKEERARLFEGKRMKRQGRKKQTSESVIQ